ncbi:hypothetical protein SAMN02745248_01348 [Hathewaya proteolytica DSM 3090]|uniref:Lipoprotein n=1 Tax=Hathewaya proteolytica DSM 3090 TaxID=1121331 RepID=A0A1M6ND97_9CLOT|nr:hypothetical protein [Hathewaya proteolytica]SHJ93576.1 hypothetical protein SAMN02745248_01348 [Hathewaya proteolytica DSM 3090]
MIKKISLIIGCLILLSITACTTKNDSNNNNENNKVNDFKEEWYLSMTTTEGNNEDLYVSNNVYDFKTNTITKSDKMKRTSQYALSVYDATSECIYYSDKDKFRGGDQLFVYDNRTKEKKQLTNELFAINYIFPRKDDVLLVAIKSSSRNLGLYRYRKDTQQLETVEFEGNKTNQISTWLMKYNPSNDEYIIQAYDENERDKLTEEWNNKNYTPEEAAKNPLNIPIYFYSYKDNKLLYLLKKDMIQGFGLIANKDKIVYKFSHADYTEDVYIYDRNEKTEKKIKNPGFVDYMYLSDDGNRLYGMCDGIKYLDLSLNKIEDCKEFKTNAYINNGVLLRRYE